MKKDKYLFDNLLSFIQKSRKKEIILKKLDNLFNLDKTKTKKNISRKTKRKKNKTKRKKIKYNH